MTTGPELNVANHHLNQENKSRDRSTTEKCRKREKKAPEKMMNERIVDEDFRKSVETMLKGISELPKTWNEMTVREQLDWARDLLEETYPNMPKSLLFLGVGHTVPGDCERSEDDPLPEWLDREKFLSGQRFAMENLAGVFFAEMLSLYTLFSFENGLKPLIVTGKSAEPFTSFRRYLSTGKRVRNWYSTDIWRKDTCGYRDIQAVRKMHSMVREKLDNLSIQDIDEASKIQKSWSKARNVLQEDFRESCPAPAPGQCPYAYSDADKFRRTRGMKQGEMAATQFGFVGLVILYPSYFGIHNCTDEDLDAFCHVWRSIGYLLGIWDEFNFCTGSLEEVKQRSRDFLEYWVKPNLRNVTPEWEHMMRCTVEGIRFYFPAVSYEQGLLYLTEMLGIPMPRLRASFGYAAWIRYHLMKKTFFWMARWPGVMATMNRGLTRSTERAMNFTEEELEVLQKRSNRNLSKGIEETVAARSPIKSTYHWCKAPFIVLLSACLLFNLPIVFREFVKRIVVP